MRWESGLRSAMTAEYGGQNIGTNVVTFRNG